MGKASGRGSGWRRSVLVHPIFTGSVAVLAVNDQMLKDRWPGLITGKLSDIAGVVMFSIVVRLVLRSSNAAVLFVSTAFIALKTLPGVAEAFAPVLGGVTRRDATDLIALSVALPAVRWTADRGKAAAEAQRGQAGSHQGANLLSLALQCAAVSIAALATSATSCESSTARGVVAEGATTVWMQTDSSFDVAPRPVVSGSVETSVPTETPPSETTPLWWRSVNGGTTWTPEAPPTALAAAEPLKEVCTSSAYCFRVVPDERVESRTANTTNWSTSFEFTADESERLRLSERSGGCGGTVSRFNSVAVVTVDGVDVVVVGMGEEGVLVRAGTGEWERRSVGEFTPVELGLPLWCLWLQAAPIGLLALGPLLLIGHFRNPGRHLRLASFICLGGFFVVAGMLLLMVLFEPRIRGVWIASSSAVVFVASLVVATLRRHVRPLDDRVAPWPTLPPPSAPWIAPTRPSDCRVQQSSDERGIDQRYGGEMERHPSPTRDEQNHQRIGDGAGGTRPMEPPS